MIDVFLVGFVGLIVFLIWFVAGLAKSSARTKQLEEELDEWSGVMNVKRKARNKLDTDTDYVKRVQSAFNDEYNK